MLKAPFLLSAIDKQTALQKHISLPEILKIIISCLPVFQQRLTEVEQVGVFAGEIIQVVNQSVMSIKTDISLYGYYMKCKQSSTTFGHTEVLNLVSSPLSG